MKPYQCIYDVLMLKSGKDFDIVSAKLASIEAELHAQVDEAVETEQLKEPLALTSTEGSLQ